MIRFSRLPIEKPSDVTRGYGWSEVRQDCGVEEFGKLVGMILVNNVSEDGHDEWVTAISANLASEWPPLRADEQDIFIDSAVNTARTVRQGVTL